MAKPWKHPALKLGLGFDEVLERFIQTKPKELAAVIKRSKAKKPPAGKPRRRLVRKKRR